MFPLFQYPPEFEPCECCKTRMVGCTFTTARKWTEQEVKDEVLHLADRLATAKWYERGDVLRRLRHWNGKLQKINEVKAEFIIK